MSLRIEAGSSAFQANASRLDSGAWSVTLDGNEHVLDVVAGHVLIDGRGVRYSVCTDAAGAPTAILLPWGDIKISTDNARQRRPSRAGAAPAGGAVTAPMNGQVVKVLMSLGQAVCKGDVVLVLEAMKMENEVTSPMDGFITELSTAVGQTVPPGAPLFRVESASPPIS